MKYLTILLSSLLLFTACSKDEAATNNTITEKAVVDYLGDPALGGFGWTIRTSAGYEIPTSLSDEYKVDELPVNVSYRKTDQVYPCRCADKKYMVEIVSISKG